MNNFNYLISVPLYQSNITLAYAAIRSFSTPIFEMEGCDSFDLAIANYTKFTTDHINTSHVIRLHVLQLENLKELINLVIAKNGTLCITGLGNMANQKKYNSWLKKNKAKIWLEIQSINQSNLLMSSNVEGIIVKGSESSGNTSEESTFILSQKYLSNKTIPTYIQGALGVNSMAALNVTGTDGIILDSQLLCLQESYLSKRQQNQLVNLRLDSLRKENGHRSYSFEDKRSNLTSGTQNVWPVGLAAVNAYEIGKTYKTLGRYISYLEKTIASNIENCKLQNPLGIDASMSKDHNTQYPIVQGPMTRVSDTPEFISAVANSGALPFLALSMIGGDKMTNLLNETKTKLDQNPWGVGLLGFVEEELRISQLKEILRVKPNFVILAGGSVDQVKKLESESIKTYLHAPTPELLKIFIDRGCNNFILEGRECGGHVGPLSSFTLWELAIDTLMQLPEKRLASINILFAGGIHDKTSAAMVSVMSTKLSSIGVNIGVLMGTAYLFTPEACNSKAILANFQQQVENCSKTAVIETSAGHSIRCLESPFIDEFNALKQQLSNDNVSQKEITAQLEKLTTGRLRIASKGINRNVKGELVKISKTEQNKNGMFMVGEIAPIHKSKDSMVALHEEVTQGSTEIIDQYELPKETKINKSNPSSIAVIGMSTLVPGATDLDTFWKNILEQNNSITEIPRSRWDWKLYFDENPKAKDKIISKWGGFIDDILFDPMAFGIPPKSLKSISPGQLLILEAVNRALGNAGYENGAFDKENTSIIVGSDGSSSLKNQYAIRTMLPQFIENLNNTDFDRLPEWNEESISGTLTNVIPGRVANRFDLGGANYSVDAACASSLTAITLAVNELEHGNSNLAIAAGVDIAQSAYSYTAFSKTQALSPTGESIPFDKEGNGIVISEGIGVIILKRLEDAERDGDRIYSVIKASACSSDGKGLGLTAPKSKGQIKSFDRCYEKAGYSPSTIGYYEAHATGTSVGDKVELQTIYDVLTREKTLTANCAIGSVKNIIGHTKTSAGIVGLIKSSLSLYYKTLSPHKIKSTPLALLQKSESPVQLLKEPKHWTKTNDVPRRAGVSAFGFGGTNTHVTLEEYTNNKTSIGAKEWPYELFAFTFNSEDEAEKRLYDWIKILQNTSKSISELAAVVNEKTLTSKGTVRIAIVSNSKVNLISSIKMIISKLKGDSNRPLPNSLSLNINSNTPEGDLAFVFPGQGAQEINMSRDIAIYFDEMRKSIENTDTILAPDKLSHIIYPTDRYTAESKEANKSNLTNTKNAQPAIGTVSIGYYNILRNLGLSPKSVAGHSYGEYVAMYAAGIINEVDLINISKQRGNIMSTNCSVDGSMAVAFASQESIEPLLVDGLKIANYNSPKQHVISGELNAIKAFIKVANEKGIKAIELNVSGPFHTNYYKDAQQEFNTHIDHLKINKPQIDIYSNTSSELYPNEIGDIKNLIKDHLLNSVKFNDQINNMYENGVRTFIEVGPKNIISGLINEIHKGKNINTISIGSNGGTLKSLLSALGKIHTLGYELNLNHLYDHRITDIKSIENAIAATDTSIRKSAVYINGSGIRLQGEEQLNSHLDKAITIENRRPLNAEMKQGQNFESESVADRTVRGYEAYQKTMQQFLEVQEDMMKLFISGEQPKDKEYQIEMPTISKIVNETPVTSPTDSAIDEVSEKTTQSSSEEIKSLTRIELTEIMTNIISERTGYDKETLTENIDLEAELGIDSIKRIEILDKILTELPPVQENALQDKMQELMRTKTISEFMDLAFSNENEDFNENVNAIVNGPIQENTTLQKCPRYIMQPFYKELPYLDQIDLEGNFIITKDSFGIAERLQDKIIKYGGDCILLDQQKIVFEKDIYRTINQYEKGTDTKYTIIHLACINDSAMPDSLDKWKKISAIESKSLFHIIRALKINENIINQIIGTSMFGGTFGRTRHIGKSLPTAGSGTGLLKSIRKEWPEIKVKSIDFDSELLPGEISHRILRELTSIEVELEIGYPEGERAVYQCIPKENAENEANSNSIPENSVILATGGAKGITAKMCKAIAKPGMTLILVGRSSSMSYDNAETESGISFSDLRNDNINIEYISTDVTDEEKVKQMLTDIYTKHKTIDVVIHGAGVIDDKNIVFKDSISFDKVFDTKVDSTYLLYKHLNYSRLSLCILFGSVSGRFGNQGQIDYAAANEVINRFAWQMNKEWRNTRVLTFNWGPWSQLGMASNSNIRLLKSQGILPISPDAGCKFFMSELSIENPCNVEIIAGEGPWKNNIINDNTYQIEDLFNQTSINYDIVD